MNFIGFEYPILRGRCKPEARLPKDPERTVELNLEFEFAHQDIIRTLAKHLAD